jgi:hypothetical protein
LVKAAKRLSGEETRARAIGSWVTLLITIPWIVSVSVLSDVDCAADRAALKQAMARENKRLVAA